MYRVGIYSYSNYNFAYLKKKIRFDAKYNPSKSLYHVDQTHLKQREHYKEGRSAFQMVIFSTQRLWHMRK